MENQSEICGDDALVMAYVAGTTAADQTAKVARHLEICASCEALARDSEHLAILYRGYLGSHLSAEVLMNLATGSVEPQPAESRHLASCEECRIIYETLPRVDAELAGHPLIEKLRDYEDQLRLGWRQFGVLRLLGKPAVAYLAMLLMLYPAYRGIFHAGALEERVQQLQTPVLLGAPEALDPGAERGSGAARFHEDNASGRVVLTFLVPVSPERYRYQVEVVNQQGDRLFFESDARSFDDVGTFALLLPPGAIEPGDYELRIEEIEREGGDVVNLFSFPFSLAR